MPCSLAKVCNLKTRKRYGGRRASGALFLFLLQIAEEGFPVVEVFAV
jgi:hypothetical protein